MAQDIFVVIMCIGVAAVGIWCWWFDNSKASREEKKDEKEKK